MSTIDLTQVSGLRAVDAEGNDLGPVSLQDLTDSITIQVLQTLSMRQQAATLEEPALLSASAQSAGSDTYENQLPEQTDLKWARALDASGNPILISKESLAAVVGARLGIGKAEEFTGDLNTLLLSSGEYKVYKLYEGCTNIPSSAGSSNGTFLIVFSYDGSCVEQIYIQCTSNRIFKRRRIINEWSDWNE